MGSPEEEEPKKRSWVFWEGKARVVGPGGKEERETPLELAMFGFSKRSIGQ